MHRWFQRGRDTNNARNSASKSLAEAMLDVLNAPESERAEKNARYTIEYIGAYQIYYPEDRTQMEILRAVAHFAFHSAVINSRNDCSVEVLRTHFHHHLLMQNIREHSPDEEDGYQTRPITP
jgi:hypothetical protein